MTAERLAGTATRRAVAFVAHRREPAEALGHALADRLNDPDGFVERLLDGLRSLADPAYREGSRRVAPGLGPVLGVRWPLLAAVERGFRAETRGERSIAPLLLVAQRLFAVPELEARWFSFTLLERTIEADPERTWQLLRRASRESADWITVDALAHPVGSGVLLDAYRWAELEQLAYSPSRWERRLVGSTIATIPFVDRRAGRQPAVAARALPLVENLIGDAEPDVQKALAWALRSLLLVDRSAVEAFLESEAATAARTGDGHRAWVVRDVLPKLEPARAAALRLRLAGVRRTTGAPPTSRAAEAVARFSGGASLPDPRGLPEPPLAAVGERTIVRSPS